jgi:transcriptional regulator with XRE-family HTH domain
MGAVVQYRHLDVLSRFGARVQQLREARDLSQGELAAKLGVHRPYLSGIERGARNPSLKTISKIASSLTVDVSYLFQNGQRPTESNRVLHPPAIRRRRYPVHAQVGQRVQRLREGRGWSVAELAMKLGFPRPYLTGVERGARNPSLLRMAQIAKALGVELVEFFHNV